MTSVSICHRIILLGNFRLQNAFPLVAGTDFHWGKRDLWGRGVGGVALDLSCPVLLVLRSLPVHYVNIFWAEAGSLITGSPLRRFLETNLLSAASRVSSLGALSIMDAAEPGCNLPLAASLDHTMCSLLGNGTSCREPDHI